VSEVVVGYDHTFGHNRTAGIQDLVRLGQRYDFSVFAVHAHAVEGEPVSSTRIRRALQAGHVEHARAMLGRPYTLSGTVVEGDRRGRTLGFPTANLRLPPAKKAIPGRGVYFVAAHVGTQQVFGIMNIGVRPTVTEGTQQILEVHLLDFSREIYGGELSVSFLRRLRDEKKFASVDDLKTQLSRDKEEALRLVSIHIRQ
jgi:riboflavin kinase/FMN adenylyltransferase